MDIKHLKAFATLAQQGSYHAAAEKLCITQPALTKQIQALEQFCGFLLFQRGRHGAALTNSGKLLYNRVGDLLSHHDDFLHFINQIQKGTTGSLALGFGISTFKLVPEWVSKFKACFPDTEVSLNDLPSDIQCQKLINGELQVGFVRLPVTEPLLSHAIMDEKLVLAIPTDTKTNPASIQAVLEHYPLLQLNPLRGKGLIDQTTAFLSANKLNARVLPIADDIHTLLALVSAENGVALLPSGVKHFLPSGVKLAQIRGKQSSWQVGVAWSAESDDILRDNFLQMLIGKNGAAVGDFRKKE